MLYFDNSATQLQLCCNDVAAELQLSKRSEAEQVINDLGKGDYEGIHPELYRAYSEPLRSAPGRVLQSGEYGDKFFDLQSRFEANADRFAAYKAHHATQQINNARFGKNGEALPFEEYKKKARGVINTFNRYQAAEYNTAVGRARTAKQWEEWTTPEHLELFPNIKWLLSRSATPREQHRKFWNRIWAKSDPFWRYNQPRNLWNCKCDWQETDEAATEGNPDVRIRSKGLEGNPVEAGKLFSDNATYFTKVKEEQRGEIDKQFYSLERKRVKLEAKRLVGQQLKAKGFDKKVMLSGKSINEFTNQPHEFIIEKNELLPKIESVLENADFIGKLVKRNESDRFTSFIFEISVCKRKSWLIVRDYDNCNNCSLYSISDNRNILEYIKKK